MARENGVLPFASFVPLVGYTSGAGFSNTEGADDIETFNPMKANSTGAIFTVLTSTVLNGTTTPADALLISLNSDGQIVASPQDTGLLTGSLMFGFNGDGLGIDRWRNNHGRTPFISTARTASSNSADQINYNGKGAHFIINVTELTGSPSVTFAIQGKDQQFASNEYYDILVSPPIIALGKTVLKVYPGIGEIPNGAASDILPRVFRVVATHANGDSITYSVGCNINV